MNVSCIVTDVKSDITERITLEEWVHGSDTYLKIFPVGIKPITLRVVDGRMVLECVNEDDATCDVLLKTYD